MTDSKPWRSDPVTALKSPRIIVVSINQSINLFVKARTVLDLEDSSRTKIVTLASKKSVLGLVSKTAGLDLERAVLEPIPADRQFAADN